MTYLFHILFALCASLYLIPLCSMCSKIYVPYVFNSYVTYVFKCYPQSSSQSS